MKFNVQLNEVEAIKRFAEAAGNCPSDVLVYSQDRRFVVDGASIMGLFSLDLSKPVIVSVEGEDFGKMLKNKVKDFVKEKSS